MISSLHKRSVNLTCEDIENDLLQQYNIENSTKHQKCMLRKGGQGNEKSKKIL